MGFFRATTIVVALLMALGFTSAAGNRAATAAEIERLNVCYSVIAAASVSTWVPYEAGIYKKYGLDVNIIYVAGRRRSPR